MNESILASQKARDSVLTDNKMESFIRDNSSLQIENEKLLKLAKQKRTESDLWKSKYDN
jgi:regulator of replication initiation timing